MNVIASYIEWSKASRVKGPSEIRMVDERKKMMRHFYVSSMRCCPWRKTRNKNLILGPVEPVPER